MIVNKDGAENKVKFISYDGRYPNLCSGELVLEVNGKVYKWERYSGFMRSGGGLNPNYEGSWQGEWKVDYSQIPDEIKEYANEIDECINDNVQHGCCGGCI